MQCSKTTMAALVCMGSAIAFPALAAPWEQVGVQQADFKRDQDVVAVRGADRHTKIRLCVEGEPLRMRDLKVNFANGGVQDVSVRQRFSPGSCTRVIDLRGRARNITSIAMYYDRVGGGRPALVRVFAR